MVGSTISVCQSISVNKAFSAYQDKTHISSQNCFVLFFSTRPAPTTPTNFLRLRFSFLLYFWLKSDLGQFKSNSPATQPLKWTKVLNFSPSRTFHRRKFHQNISTIFNFIESHDGHELADWKKIIVSVENLVACWWKWTTGQFMERSTTLVLVPWRSVWWRIVRFGLNETVGDTLMKNVRRELRPSFIYHFMN